MRGGAGMQKITLRNQRVGTSAKHNQHKHIEDVNREEKALLFFDIENDSYRLKKLKNVKLPKMEYKYYKSKYQKALDLQNEKYIKNRHKDRVKTIRDWLTDKNKQPDEQILQIGSVQNHDDVSREEFEAMIIEYCKEHEKQFGSNIHIIDVAFHYCEEGLPHVHIRSVADYEKDGVRTIGMEKALKALGLERPDTSKKEGRYNNRKMTLTSMEREMWVDICRSHGLEIDTEVKEPGKKHQEIAIYKNNKELEKQQAQKLKNIEVLEKQREQKLNYINKLQQLEETIEEQEKLTKDLDNGINKKFKQYEDLTLDELRRMALKKIYRTNEQGDIMIKNGHAFLTDWAINICEEITNKTLVNIANTSLDHVKEVAENIEILKYVNDYFPKLKEQILESGRQKEYGTQQIDEQISR